MNKLLSYLGIGATTILASIGIANAQTKTLDGIIADQKGTPQKNIKVELNTPTGEQDLTDENGYYHLTTTDYPTGIDDIAQVKETLKAYPNPARDHATLNVPTLKGRVEIYNELGQALGQANLEQQQDIKFTGNKLVLLRYTNNDGAMQTTKLLIQRKNNINLHIQKTNEYNKQTETKQLKNAKIEDTFGYELTITGTNIKDTIATIIGFYKNQTNHNQDITVNSKPKLINENYDGETFAQDTLTIPLDQLIYSDDKLQTNINFTEGDAAKIRNDTLLVYGNTKLSITANDGENDPITTQNMQFNQNKAPRIISDYAGETFTADTLKKALAEIFYDEDQLTTAINFTEGNEAMIRNDSLIVYGNTKLTLTANDGVNNPVTTKIMQFIKESYKKLTINASNEETNQTLNNARVIIDDLEGKLDTTYTENGQAQLNIKPVHLYVIKLEKTGYTGWVQELNSEKDTTIEKQLATQDTILVNGYKIPYMDAFDNGWRLSHKQTMKWDYDKERTLMIKTTDSNGNTLSQHYMDRLWEYIGKFETEANNTPTLTQEQKNKIHNFFSRMNVEYVTEWPSDQWKKQNVVYMGWSTTIPGTGSMGATKGTNWEMINAIGEFHQSIVDNDYQMSRTTKQELYSILFGAVDPFGSSEPNESILHERTTRTTAGPLDERLFKHEMNAPAGTAHKEDVEIAPISAQAATSILVPAQYNR